MDDKDPWYKKAGAILLAFLVAALGVLVTILGKGYVTKKLEEKEQNERNKNLDKSLNAVSETARVKEDLVKAEHSAKVEEVTRSYEKKTEKVAEEIRNEVDALDDIDLPDALINSLKNAERKLR